MPDSITVKEPIQNTHMDPLTPSSRLKLENQVAVVTGGARGIGPGIVRRFVQEGAQVVFSDLLTEKAKALEEELGKEVAFYRADATSPSDCEALMTMPRSNPSTEILAIGPPSAPAPALLTTQWRPPKRSTAFGSRQFTCLKPFRTSQDSVSPQTARSQNFESGPGPSEPPLALPINAPPSPIPFPAPLSSSVKSCSDQH
jgi:hypothetical protein